MYGYDYYDYGSSYETAATGVAVFGVGMIIMWLISIAISVFSIVCMWKVFKKAGKGGWEAIIPIYNIIVLLEITELPMWYIALFLVPIANIYAMFKIYIELAHKFGKSTGFGIGLVFLNPIFMGMLAFGKNSYNGVLVSSNQSQPVEQQTAAAPQQAVNNVNQTIDPLVGQSTNPVAQSMQPQNANVTSNVIEQKPIVEPVQPQTITTQPKFCTKCGSPLVENAKFCTKCGNQL